LIGEAADREELTGLTETENIVDSAAFRAGELGMEHTAVLAVVTRVDWSSCIFSLTVVLDKAPWVTIADVCVWF
jgi:hypothetical protein